jgi:alkylhydroperoxidase family enzyme
MARVNYVDESSHPELIEEIKAVRAQRRGKLIPVYGLLLNSPELALSWMQFLNAVRWKIKLSARLREMVILRVALHNKSEYVIDVHRKNFTESDGLSHDECDALLKKKLPQSSFSPEELSVIAFVDQLTLKANVDDEVFAGVKAHLSDRQLVELSVLIGAYNMHTRVMSALRIDAEK